MSDSFDLDAAGLRADGRDLGTHVEVLGAKLEEALPAQTTVMRRRKGLFSGEKRVEQIEVRLGEGHYALAFDGHEVAARRAVEVRGVVIRREQLDLDAWISALAAELREQAAGSAQAREALERLVG